MKSKHFFKFFLRAPVRDAERQYRWSYAAEPGRESPEARFCHSENYGCLLKHARLKKSAISSFKSIRTKISSVATATGFMTSIRGNLR